jgi:hypothetical protein
MMNFEQQPTAFDFSWVEKLALEEINLEESGIVKINEHLDPNILLEEASINYMDKLRDTFEVHINKFNELRGNPISGQNIRIFKISNTVNDFMLFRNSLRLIFARKSNDIISVGFLGVNKEITSPRLGSFDYGQNPGSHEIKASLGPFNTIRWTFMGDTFSIDSLVKYYLSEFIRNSAK